MLICSNFALQQRYFIGRQIALFERVKTPVVAEKKTSKLVIFRSFVRILAK